MSENLSSPIPFKYRENSFRQGRYQRDDKAEHFLDRLNLNLTSIEPLKDELPDQTWPLVFVLGLPRSGTTLLTQLLGHSLDVAVVNNLVARFWLAPVTGMRLSRIILGDEVHTNFLSDYGKTPHPSEPHEFSYFWHHWLKMEDMPPYDPSIVANEIDWAGLCRTLRQMSAVSARPLVMKAPDLGYHLDHFAQLLPESIFLWARRDTIDIACSIYRGRMKYFGDDSTWLGQFPVEYDELLGLSGEEQVAGQVYCLERMFERAMATVPSSRAAAIGLDELCQTPKAVIDRITKMLYSIGGEPVTERNSPPDFFQINSYKDDEYYSVMRKLLVDFRKKWPA